MPDVTTLSQSLYRVLLAFTLAGLGFPVGAQALPQQWLILSDIDDTLKITNVRAPLPELLTTAAKTKDQSFLGMATLLQMLTCKQSFSNPHCLDAAARDIAYVTAAPGPLAVFGKTMLKQDGFPDGKVYERPLFADKFDFKVGVILQLIEEHQADAVILLGDNGELDPVIYEQVGQLLQESNSAVQIFTYIHMIHPIIGTSDQLFPQQKGFITAMDLAAQMVDQGLLAPEALTALILQLMPVWNHPSPGPLKSRLLPAYLSCGDWADENGDSLFDLDLAGSQAKTIWPQFVDSLLLYCRQSL